MLQFCEMILPFLGRYDMRGASVFGSWARGEMMPEFDIDVLLESNDSFRHLVPKITHEVIEQELGKRAQGENGCTRSGHLALRLIYHKQSHPLPAIIKTHFIIEKNR